MKKKSIISFWVLVARVFLVSHFSKWKYRNTEENSCYQSSSECGTNTPLKWKKFLTNNTSKANNTNWPLINRINSEHIVWKTCVKFRDSKNGCIQQNINWDAIAFLHHWWLPISLFLLVLFDLFLFGVFLFRHTQNIFVEKLNQHFLVVQFYSMQLS